MFKSQNSSAVILKCPFCVPSTLSINHTQSPFVSNAMKHMMIADVLSPPYTHWFQNTKTSIMIHFVILFSRQGKLRLQKWYEAKEAKEKKKICRELTSAILLR